MAHYLAELMAQAERETEPAKKRALEEQCREVILRLWADRDRLPGGARPLGQVDEALKALVAMRAEVSQFPQMVRRHADDLRNPWLAFAVDSYAADRRMSSIAFLAGLLDSRFGREKRWVEEHEGQLSENERQLIRGLDNWLNSRDDWPPARQEVAATSLSAEERNRRILDELERSVRSQEAALEQLQSRVPSLPHTPPEPE
jgi:hypothetical protein